MEPTKIIHMKDGVVKGVSTPREALGKLLALQPFSKSYALRWGGWREIEMYGETDIVFTRDVMRSEMNLPLDPGGEGTTEDGDYVEVTAGTVGVLCEETDSRLRRYITISVDGAPGLIYPVDSYKLTPH